MSKTLPTSAEPRRQLTLFDSTCIIVGIIIGSGIYETTPLIAQQVGSPWMLLAIWCLGGLLALMGALCYAELSTAFPEDGGDYIFLRRGYGRTAGFLFAWSEFWIIRPGNIGMMAFVFGRYANQLYPLNLSASHSRLDVMAYALVAILVLTAINVLGLRAGKLSQNVLTVAKVAGLLLICAVGLFWSSRPTPATMGPEAASSNYRLAMILVLFTYGGWNEMSYVAAEVRNPQKNIFWALVLGTAAVMGLYLLINMAFLQALGLAGIRGSSAIAADVMRGPLGERGARFISVCVCLSCLGAINGMMFTGSRIYYVLGQDHRLFAWLGKWNARREAPVRSLLMQGVLSAGLILTFGWNQDGFTRLLDFTAPVFWFFIFMVSICVLLLRQQQPLGERPYRVILYPWIPILFSIVCVLLVDASFSYALTQGGSEAYWAVGIVLAGWLVSAWEERRRKR